jgi:hypothetical protein
MTSPAGQPPDLHEARMTVCHSRPRRCEVVLVDRCRSCGWSAIREPDGALDLFTPIHDELVCARRQRDRKWAREQDIAALQAAGVDTTGMYT